MNDITHRSCFCRPFSILIVGAVVLVLDLSSPDTARAQGNIVQQSDIVQQGQIVSPGQSASSSWLAPGPWIYWTIGIVVAGVTAMGALTIRAAKRITEPPNLAPQSSIVQQAAQEESDSKRTQKIQEQIAEDDAEQREERFKIMKETQEKIYEIAQDVTEDKDDASSEVSENYTKD